MTDFLNQTKRLSYPMKAQHRAKVGLIGVGGFGAYHLKFIAEIELQGIAVLTSVADPGIDRLPQVTCELRKNKVRCYSDYLEMIREEPLDLVILATPIPLHEGMTLEVLKRTTAAIYLEKPPAPTLFQLKRLIAEDKEARVHVGFQMSMWKVFKELKSWICEGRLGKIHRIICTGVWPRGDAYYSRNSWAGRMQTTCGLQVFDGPATNALAHLVHGAMFLAGNSLEEFDQPERVCGEFYRARPIESYDAAWLAGAFASGIHYTVGVAHCSRDERDFIIRVEGEEGYGQISNDGKLLQTNLGFPPMQVDEPYDAALHRETLLRIQQGRKPVNSLQDCTGYSLATCGGFLSSQGIRSIPRELVEVDSQSGVWHAQGMSEAVASVETHEISWSRQNLEWTDPREPLWIENYDMTTSVPWLSGEVSENKVAETS